MQLLFVKHGLKTKCTHCFQAAEKVIDATVKNGFAGVSSDRPSARHYFLLYRLVYPLKGSLFSLY